jgi:hypothetical protein
MCSGCCTFGIEGIDNVQVVETTSQDLFNLYCVGFCQ